MQLLETISNNGNTSRFYVDSKRVSQQRFRDIKTLHRLDCFQTIIRRGFIRHYCCARPHLTTATR